ncbi:MAG TPA: hypothetical protein VEK11_22250 [Thermoanaerobaculia bacterium]|nr:hypothetical protein [Thermoanaerobaculia bacterium]
MTWQKLGLVFRPDNLYPWMRTHAANCVAMRLEGSRYRVFFSTRDERNRASIAFVEFDLDEPRRILRIADRPVLSPGEAGLFDDSGVSLACILRVGERWFLYYTGWNLGVTVPWRNSIGLAISDDGENFTRHSLAPVLDRNHVDPYSLSYPFVMQDGDGFSMWYGSNLRWGAEQRDMDHVIKYARSRDALHWEPTGEICIGIDSPDEYAFSRPCVVKDGDAYRMWYSFRGAAYRIGYAESRDGRVWVRKDPGISVSAEGWDSETVEYPWVFDHDGTRFMLYNGNSYGRTGFGLARWNGGVLGG